jgi:hypothetical protein
MMRRSPGACVLLSGCMLLLGAAIAAEQDQAVLLDGSVIRGQVRLEATQVSVETPRGSVLLPRASVASVTAGGQTTVLNEPARPAGRDAQQEPAAADAQPQGAQRPAAAAEQKLDGHMSVDFRDVALADALRHVIDSAGLNFSYRPSDLARDARVSLSLKDIAVRRVLDLMLEPAGLGWTVRDGIVQVRPAHELTSARVRVYDTRDLLVGTGDRHVPPVTGLAAYGTPSGYTLRGETGCGRNGYGYGGAAGPYRGESAMERAFALATLITDTVAPESWARPAVRAYAGADAPVGRGGTGFEDVRPTF